tara:strand:+ start:124549 stop:125337 length:789 start_codon:yes stop_codon:yes gene_type:complete
VTHYAKQPLAYSDIFRHAWQLYRGTFKHVVPVALLGAIIASILEVASGYGFGDAINNTPWDYMVVLWYLHIPSLIFALLAYNAIYIRYQAHLDQTACSYGQAWWRGLLRLPSTFLATLLYVVIAVIGLFLFVVPGIIVLVSLFFFYPMTVVRHENSFKALCHSHRLVWPHWWRSLSVIIVPILSLLIAIFAIQGVSLGMGVLTHGSLLIMRTTGMVLGILFGTFVCPWMIAVFMQQLMDLEVRGFTDYGIEPADDKATPVEV